MSEEKSPALNMTGERDWLVNMINGIYGPGSVTDIGFDLVQGQAELVYENRIGRFEVTIKELPR